MIIPYPYDRTGAGAATASGGAVLGERGVFTWLRDGKLYQRAMELDGVFLNSAKVRSMAVLSDGTARNTTVHTGGTQTILNGGVAEGVTVTVTTNGMSVITNELTSVVVTNYITTVTSNVSSMATAVRNRMSSGGSFSQPWSQMGWKFCGYMGMPEQGWDRSYTDIVLSNPAMLLPPIQ